MNPPTARRTVVGGVALVVGGVALAAAALVVIHWTSLLLI